MVLSVRPEGFCSGLVSLSNQERQCQEGYIHSTYKPLGAQSSRIDIGVTFNATPSKGAPAHLAWVGLFISFVVLNGELDSLSTD